MSATPRVLAVVPARSGSQGIRDKNMQVVGGLSLIARTGQTLRACPSVDRAIISTDAAAYATEAAAHGLDAPFTRPAELSTHEATAVDTVIHALLAAEAHYGCAFETVLVVEPTCPLRRAEDIESAIVLLRTSGADSVVTVSRADSKYHPRKLLALADGRLTFLDPSGASVTSRQQLAPVYFRNGACYALRRAFLLEKRAIFGPDTRGLVIDRPLVNIDDAIELEFARFLFERGGA